MEVGDSVAVSSAQSKPEVACTEKTEFTNIPLEAEKHTKLRKPRRILHFSDGVLEEYSSDEEEPVKTGPVVDPRKLTWMPWVWYYVVHYAASTLSIADTCGEKLAYFFEEEEKEKAAELRWQEKQQGEVLSSVQVQPEISDVSLPAQDDRVEKY
ncbi:hypothetical protein ScPMuIL_013811 [Solemya velum]